MDFNDKTLTLFKGFMNDILKVFPEHTECINKNYSDILELDNLDAYKYLINSFTDSEDPNRDNYSYEAKQEPPDYTRINGTENNKKSKQKRHLQQHGETPAKRVHPSLFVKLHGGLV